MEQRKEKLVQLKNQHFLEEYFQFLVLVQINDF